MTWSKETARAKAEQSHTRGVWATGLLVGGAASIVGVVSPIGMLGFRPWHVLMVLALLISVVSADRGRVRGLRITAIDIVILLFVIVCSGAELINSSDLGYPPDYATAVSPLYYLIGYVAARIAVSSREALRHFCVALALPALLAVVVTVAQFFSREFAVLSLSFAPAEGLANRIVAGRYVRPTGLIGHWTGAGFYFCTALVAICVAIVLLRRERAERIPPYYWIIVLSCIVGAMSVLTFSVAITVVAILLSMWYLAGMNIRGLVTFGLLAAVLAFLFGDLFEERVAQQQLRSAAQLPNWVPNTLAYRWQIWTEQTIPAILERPLTGWGTNVYDSSAASRLRPSGLVWHSAESQWFHTAISYGIPAAAIFASVIFLIVRFLWKALRRGDAISVALPFLTLIFATALGSLTVPAFTNRGMPAILWPLLGAVIAAHLLPSKDSRGTHDSGAESPSGATATLLKGRQ